MKKHIFTFFYVLILIGEFVQPNKIDYPGPMPFQNKNERSKKGEAAYEPKVSVITSMSSNITTTQQAKSPTSQHANRLIIAIKDNGSGIPDAIKDKIFQPFFTTKPKGQGTGLGLSLSYDIVKAHGGELKVESKEGEGSEFTIKLSM